MSQLIIYCGGKMRKQKDIGPLLVFVMLCFFYVLLSIVANCFIKTENKLNNANSVSPLEIKTHSFCTSRYGTRAICGTVLNNSANTYSLVSVDINLYDKDGALIGNTYDSIRDLESGRQWKFETLLTVNATGYNIKVKGY